MNGSQGYTLVQTHNYRDMWMGKTIVEEPGAFGKRLAKLRKAAGYTQQELAEEIGATRRMIAYYETESDHPPTNMLVNLANALNITTDELLGRKAPKQKKQPDSRLLRRMQQIEALDAVNKRQVIQVIDTYIKAAQFKKQA